MKRPLILALLVATALLCRVGSATAAPLINTYTGGGSAPYVSNITTTSERPYQDAGVFINHENYWAENLVDGTGFFGTAPNFTDTDFDTFPDYDIITQTSGPLVPYAHVLLPTSTGEPINKMWVGFTLPGSYDLDSMRLWNYNSNPIPNALGERAGVKDAYIWVSDLEAIPTIGPSEAGASPGGGWTKVMGPGTNGIFEFAEGPNPAVTTYDGQSHNLSGTTARHVLIDVESTWGTNTAFVAMNEVQFFGDHIPDPPPPTPLPGLSRGHNILLQRGLQVQALVFPSLVLSEVHSPGVDQAFDPDRWAESNFTTPHIWANRYLPDEMPGAVHPNGESSTPWSLWVNGHPGDLSSTDPIVDLTPWESTLLAVQFGDEQDVTDPFEEYNLRTAMALWRTAHPHVLTYTNQSGFQASFAEMQAYMLEVEPDILSFDRYPFDHNIGSTPYFYYAHRSFFYRDAEIYRKLGLAGIDGTGNKPIPTSLYTQTYNPVDPVDPENPPITSENVSESEIRLNQFAAWAFGFKMIDSFIYEQYGDLPTMGNIEAVLFDGAGTANPTPEFYEVAETNRQSVNLGPALVRLISTDLRMEIGRHMEGAATVNNPLPFDAAGFGSVAAWDSAADPYITDITATNQGTLNDSLEGDVIVGYFEPLDASFTNAGHEDDIYFMIVNGLSDKVGSAADTEQLIRLDFDFGASGIDSLQRLSRDTGIVEQVSLISGGGSLYHLDLILEGGTGDLFKFNNGGTFVGFLGDGDFDMDGDVDGADFLKWQRDDGTSGGLTDWQNNYGNGTLAALAGAASSVPEPTSALLLVLGCCAMGLFHPPRALRNAPPRAV